LFISRFLFYWDASMAAKCNRAAIVTPSPDAQLVADDSKPEPVNQAAITAGYFVIFTTPI